MRKNRTKVSSGIMIIVQLQAEILVVMHLKIEMIFVSKKREGKVENEIVTIIVYIHDYCL